MAWTAEARARAREATKAKKTGQIPEAPAQALPAARSGAVFRTDADLYPSPEVFGIIQHSVEAFHAAGLGKGKNKTQMLALALRGRELSIPVGQAIEHLFISEDGNLGMTGELMRARINSSGIGRIEVVRYDDECVMLKAIRYERGGDSVTDLTWDRAIATQRGVWASNEQWRKNPRNMLFNRCTSELARQRFSDVLAGVAYVPEELGTGRGPTPTATAAPPRAAVPERVAPAPAVPAPVAQAQTAPEPTPQPVQDAATATQAASPTPDPPPEPPTAQNGAEEPPAPTPRPVTFPVQVTDPGGGIRTVFTAGVRKEQIQRIQQLTSPGVTPLHPRQHENLQMARGYLQNLGIPIDLKQLTAEEADALVALLEQPSEPVPATAPPVQADPVAVCLAELDRVIAHYGIEEHRVQIGRVGARAHGKERIEDVEPKQLAHFVDEIRRLVTVDKPTFGHVLGMMEQQGGPTP